MSTFASASLTAVAVQKKRLEATLVVPAPARVVEIQAFRRPSLRFDSKIAGTVWVDSVSLRRIN